MVYKLPNGSRSLQEFMVSTFATRFCHKSARPSSSRIGQHLQKSYRVTWNGTKTGNVGVHPLWKFLHSTMTLFSIVLQVRLLYRKLLVLDMCWTEERSSGVKSDFFVRLALFTRKFARWARFFLLKMERKGLIKTISIQYTTTQVRTLLPWSANSRFSWGFFCKEKTQEKNLHRAGRGIKPGPSGLTASALAMSPFYVVLAVLVVFTQR